MCGRFGLTRSPQLLAEKLGARWGRRVFTPRYNIAPTIDVCTVLNEPERPVRDARWGLVPSYGRRLDEVKLSTHNARIEGVETAPLYREAFRWRRCVVFGDGYYEWRRDGKRKFSVRLRPRELRV